MTVLVLPSLLLDPHTSTDQVVVLNRAAWREVATAALAGQP